MSEETAVVIVGAGLAGLVVAGELAERGKRVITVEQESEKNLGGCIFSGRIAGRAAASII